MSTPVHAIETTGVIDEKSQLRLDTPLPVVGPSRVRVIVLDIQDPGFSTTGLRVSSTLRLHRLMTVTTSIIQRELGELPPRIQTEANARLRDLFEL